MKTHSFRTTLLTLGLTFITAAGLLSLSACDSVESGGTGTMRVKLTDAPFPYELVDSAVVTVVRVEVVSEDDSTHPEILMNQPKSYNLLELRNGVTADVAFEEIPEGEYHQIRFIVDDDAKIYLKDGRSFALKIPSGTQTGLKLNLPDLQIEDGEEVEVTIDFDVAQSFVLKGSLSNIQGFNFKPVLKVKAVTENEVSLPVDTTSVTG